MLNEKNIKILSAAAGVCVAGILGLLFHLPGLLLGGILGVFGAVFLTEKLRERLPENRRQRRRALRHEGLR